MNSQEKKQKGVNDTKWTPFWMEYVSLKNDGRCGKVIQVNKILYKGRREQRITIRLDDGNIVERLIKTILPARRNSV